MFGKLVVVLATLSLFTDLIVAAGIIFPTLDQYNANPCTRLNPATSWSNLMGTSYIVLGTGIGNRCPFVTLKGLVDFPSLNIFAFSASYTYYEPDDVNQTSLQETNPPQLGVQVFQSGVIILFISVNGTYVYNHISTVVGYVPNGGFAGASCFDASSGIAQYIYLFNKPPNDQVVDVLKQQIASRNLTTDLVPRHHGIDCHNEPQ